MKAYRTSSVLLSVATKTLGLAEDRWRRQKVRRGAERGARDGLARTTQSAQHSSRSQIPNNLPETAGSVSVGSRSAVARSLRPPSLPFCIFPCALELEAWGGGGEVAMRSGRGTRGNAGEVRSAALDRARHDVLLF